MKKLILIVFFSATMIGCGLVGGSDNKKPSITFQTTQTSYRLADTVTAVLRNNSTHAIQYNLCGTPLERKKDGKWVFMGPELAPAMMCQEIAIHMAPGGKAIYRLPLNDSTLKQPLPSGTYRLTTDVAVRKLGDLMLHTHPFRISNNTHQ